MENKIVLGNKLHSRFNVFDRDCKFFSSEFLLFFLRCLDLCLYNSRKDPTNASNFESFYSVINNINFRIGFGLIIGQNYMYKRRFQNYEYSKSSNTIGFFPYRNTDFICHMRINIFNNGLLLK